MHEKVSARSSDYSSGPLSRSISVTNCPDNHEPIMLKESIIKSALSALSDRLVYADTKIDVLSDAISPILRKEPCKATGDNEKSETVNCQLSIELECMIGLTTRICEKIDDLLDRTQL